MKNLLMPEPAIIVIFGITGDLVKKKLFPALCDLINANLLHEQTVIVGVTRQSISAEEMLDRLTNGEKQYDTKLIERIKNKLYMHTMDITSGPDYDVLLQSLNKIEDERGLCLNRLYYLSIPSQVFAPIVRYMGEHGLNQSCQHNIAETRLLIEKPFGYDNVSAKELIVDTAKYFKESQIFRIDHYLAKETVQNILSFRVNNSIFESLWDSKSISRIDITAFEKIGIEGRVIFYEQTGALRDLIQSHLLQLMAIITMEEPLSLSSENIHKAKLELLDQVEPIANSDISKSSMRAQYETYREEVNNPKSNVETYAAIKLNINNPRWRGVPIVIKTAKQLSQKNTEVSIIFKRPASAKAKHNSLSFRIQPNEGIDLALYVKKPSLETQLKLVTMDFSYDRFFDSKLQPDAYERVLVDVIKGDHTLFTTSEEVLAVWRIVDPVLNHWSKGNSDLLTYKNNSDGPEQLPEWLKPDYML